MFRHSSPLKQQTSTAKEMLLLDDIAYIFRAIGLNKQEYKSLYDLVLGGFTAGKIMTIDHISQRVKRLNDLQ